MLMMMKLFFLPPQNTFSFACTFHKSKLEKTDLLSTISTMEPNKMSSFVSKDKVNGWSG